MNPVCWTKCDVIVRNSHVILLVRSALTYSSYSVIIQWSENSNHWHSSIFLCAVYNRIISCQLCLSELKWYRVPLIQQAAPFSTTVGFFLSAHWQRIKVQQGFIQTLILSMLKEGQEYALQESMCNRVTKCFSYYNRREIKI